MELTELQLFKGYIRYLIEEHISIVIFAANTKSHLPDLWKIIQPWNMSEKDLWDCFEEFDQWKNGEQDGSEIELFKKYIRCIANNYLKEFFEIAQHHNDLCYIVPWRKGEKDIWECFDFDPFEKFVKDYLGYLEEDHLGDCIGLPTTCARCLAEAYFFEKN